MFILPFQYQLEVKNYMALRAHLVYVTMYGEYIIKLCGTLLNRHTVSNPVYLIPLVVEGSKGWNHHLVIWLQRYSLEPNVFSFRQGPEMWQTWFLLHILALYVTELQTRLICN